LHFLQRALAIFAAAFPRTPAESGELPASGAAKNETPLHPGGSPDYTILTRARTRFMIEM
jgi:hypothetical protein